MRMQRLSRLVVATLLALFLVAPVASAADGRQAASVTEPVASQVMKLWHQLESMLFADSRQSRTAEPTALYKRTTTDGLAAHGEDDGEINPPNGMTAGGDPLGQQ